MRPTPTTYRTRQLRRRHTLEHLADLAIGVSVGIPIAGVLWLATIWLAVR